MRKMKNTANIILGIAGAGGVEIANHIELPTSTETKDIISIIIQIAIGVVTLLGLLKKKKSSNQ
jgi:hypothetical protein